MKIFLDDERDPVTDDFIVCRNASEFADVVLKAKKIEFISFDHDLGEVVNGMQCAKLLADYDMSMDFLKEDFTFYVHSQNHVGAENINKFLTDYLEKKRSGFFLVDNEEETP